MCGGQCVWSLQPVTEKGGNELAYEVQVLIPQPFMGTIIGTGGTKIKELRSVSNTEVILFTNSGVETISWRARSNISSVLLLDGLGLQALTFFLLAALTLRCLLHRKLGRVLRYSVSRCPTPMSEVFS